MFESAVHWILVGLLMVVSVLMTFFILLQEGKGGGLTALGGTRAAGVEGVTNPIRRATAVLAVIWFLCAGTLAVVSRGKGGETNNDLYNNEPAKKAEAGAPAGSPPATPLLAPANGAGEMMAAPGSGKPVTPVAPVVVPAGSLTGENKTGDKDKPAAVVTPDVEKKDAPAVAPAAVEKKDAPAATPEKDKASAEKDKAPAAVAPAPVENKEAEKKPDAAAPAPKAP